MNIFIMLNNRLLHPFLLVLLTFFISVSSVHSGPLLNGLVAHWPLNDGSGATANDSTASNNDGTISGASWSSNSLIFDGSNDYVNLGDFDVSGSAITLSAKVISTELTNCGSNDCRIISKATSVNGNDHYWMLSTISSGGATRLRFRLKVNGTTQTLVSDATGVVVEDDELFLVAATYDGSHMRLYKNGIEVGNKAASGNIGTNSNVEAWIGGNPNGATSRPWKGTIADVRIYNRALTAVEVADLSTAAPDAESCTAIFEDDFEDDAGLSDKWRTLKALGGFSPKIKTVNGNKHLRLTNRKHDLSTAVTLDYVFPSENNKFVMEFDYYAYGGCSDGDNYKASSWGGTSGAGDWGADGLSVILFDSSAGKTPSVGASGGSLGYANGNIVLTNDSNEAQDGFEKGWFGLGLDEYGNFKTNDEGRLGISGSTDSLDDEDDEEPNTAAIRGSEASGYRLLAATDTLDEVLAKLSAASKYKSGRYRFTVDMSITGYQNVKLERDTGSGYVTIIDSFNALDASYNQGVTPENFRIAFSSGSGGGCNIHAIDNVKICGIGKVYSDVSYDYGDAPTTGTNYGEAIHTIVDGIYLGSSLPDDETENQATEYADGDDNDGNDDDDGITIPALMLGDSANITATVSGEGAYLQAWIDWNGDGDFYDSGELVVSNLQDNDVDDANNTTGTISFPVTVPADATIEKTFARFRWSTTPHLPAVTLESADIATDGEVEDYAITINSGSCDATVIDIIPEGNPTGHLTSNQVSWNIEGDAELGTLLLHSFTVAGEPNSFTDLIMPDAVNYQFENPGATSQYIVNRSITGVDITADSSVFKAAVLEANASRDLSHYLSLDGGTHSTDYTEFLYNKPIKSAGNRYVLVSERLGNNAMGIEALDADGNIIGNMVPVTPGTTNINSGVDVEVDYLGTHYKQRVHFTIYPLTAIAPRGTDIHGIRLTQTQTGTSANDGGDGKIFIMVDPKKMPKNCSCEAAPVIPDGNPAAALTAAQVSWDITGTFGNGPITLNSFTISGEPRPFTDIIMPDSVGYQFQELDAGHQFITNQGVSGTNSGDDPTVFQAALLEANVSRDLSHYLSLDGGIHATDYTEFLYNTPIQSAGNRYVLISERWGNNGMQIQALDADGGVINAGVPIIVKTDNNTTNIPSGAVIRRVLGDGLEQEVYFTIYPLTAIAPRTTEIYGIRLTQIGPHPNGATDGGDGKVFIMVDPQTMPNCNDRGDAPTTDTQYGEAMHTLLEGVYLGSSLPDAEISSQATVNADGDDNNGDDDEDGISIPELRQGATATFTATVSGLGGYLQGWIDWNGDGDFTDLNEQVVTNLQDNTAGDADNTTGIISFDVSVPNSATITQTYARFRWSNTLNLDSSIPANSGEVEDYSLTILENTSSCSIDNTAVGVYSTASVASNSTYLSAQTRIYQAKYNSANWEGQLRSYDLVTAAQGGNVKTQKWNAADTINRSNRKLFTYDPTQASGSRGKSLTWDNLNSQQRTSLIAGDSTELGQKRLTWLQGGDTDEGTLLRTRTKILGDIVHSNISFKSNITNYGYKQLSGNEGSSYATFLTAKKSSLKTLYVGANDGMLHAINADNGAELFAYIPNDAFPKIAALSDKKYGCSGSDCLPHEYTVDGVSSLGDAYFDSNWHTVLLGTLGLGGKTIYALDVTDSTGSDEFTSQDVLWEISTTQAPDNASVYASHLGYSLPKASVVRAANGKWVAIVANGYDSESNKAVLFIIDVETGELIKTFNTGVGTEDVPNGLSSPTAVDSNGDSIADIIYAGDLLGNLWAFDISHSNPDNWTIRDGTSQSPAPFFKACEDNACSNPQIITAPPQVGRHPSGGLMVYIGTGKYTDVIDNFYEGATPPVRSFYGLRDQGSPIEFKNDLQQQSILAEISINSDLKSRVTSNTNVDFSSEDGWYMDFLKPPSDTKEGERVISQALLREGRLIFTTIIPHLNNCAVGGKSWIMELNAVTGKRLSVIPFDTNNDKQFTVDDNVDYDNQTTIISGLQQPSLGMIFATPTIINHSTRAEGKYVTGSAGTIGMFRESASQFSGRMSWRQVR